MDRSYFSQLFPSNIYTYDVSGTSTHFLDLNSQINDYMETAHMDYMNGWGKTHKLSIESFAPGQGVLDLIEKVPAFKSVIKEGVERYLRSCAPKADRESCERLFNNCYIDGAWITQLENNNYAHQHQHMSSQISGVYYHSIPEGGEGGEIYFTTPVFGHYVCAATTSFPCPQVVIEPEEGTMILFPSYLEHGVRTYLGDEPRISLSFNIEETSSSNSNRIPLFT